MIERLWVEFNNRVNYPIKIVPTEMAEAGKITLDDPPMEYCVSFTHFILCMRG